ncbi:MAG: insulinase family protein [Deltaproteobacteria bacterium]|nr:insulinase family protein [Deltaproteobacteria bacterium]
MTTRRPRSRYRRSIAALLLWLTACSGPARTPDRTPKDPSAPVGIGSGSAAAPLGVTLPDPTKDPTPIPLDPTIRKGVLANGLTYYVKANKQPGSRVQLWLAIDAGSVQEDDPERGLAHMVEHLAFEGTRRFPKHDIQNFIERSGMRFGADLNAYTSFDETVYQLMVPTDDPKTVIKGLDVLRDWAADVTFDPKEVVDERKIIEEERRTRNSGQFRILQQLIPVAYQGSKYAQRLPIGTTEVITTATADKLAKFYKSWYRPDLMAVIVVGDVDAAAIEKEIKARFADVPVAAAGAPKRVATPVSTDLPPRYVVARDRETAVFGVSIDHQFPHRTLATAADLRRALVEAMFSQLVSSRLETIAKRATSPWTSASVSINSNLRPVDELSLAGTAKSGKQLLDVVGELTGELARVRQHGFSPEELEQVRATLLQRYTEGVREADTRDSGGIADEMLRNFLVDEFMAGPTKEHELAVRLIPTITNAELVAIAGAARDRGRVVMITAPLKGDVPSEADITKRIAEAAAKPVAPWQAVDLSQPLISAQPTPGTITEDKSLSNGVTTWTLSNGARVYLKQTDFKKDEVTLVAVSSGGTSVVSDASYPHARFAADIVNASGLGNYGAEELAKKLAGKKVSVATTIDAEQERVSAAASPDDLEPMLQLVHAAFTAPRKDPAAFEAWKAQQLQLAAVLEANTQARFVIGAFEYLFSKHPRIPLPFPTTQRIAAIDLDKALAQYRARFANAADFSFVIVGAYDPAKLRPLVERYLASLPATRAPRETVRDVNLRSRKGVAATTLRHGTEQKAMTMLVTSMPQRWSLPLEWDADILQHVLDLELLAVLREKLGGTYSVSVQAQASRTPPPQTLSLVVFESDPARAKAMQVEAWKTIDALATTPLGQDTLDKVREQIIKAHDSELKENSFWSDTLVRVARFGDPLDAFVTIDQVTSRVKAPLIQKAAQQFLGKPNRTTVTLLPEEPKK